MNEQTQLTLKEWLLNKKFDAFKKKLKVKQFEIETLTFTKIELEKEIEKS